MAQNIVIMVWKCWELTISGLSCESCRKCGQRGFNQNLTHHLHHNFPQLSDNVNLHHEENKKDYFITSYLSSICTTMSLQHLFKRSKLINTSKTRSMQKPVALKEGYQFLSFFFSLSLSLSPKSNNTKRERESSSIHLNNIFFFLPDEYV